MRVQLSPAQPIVDDDLAAPWLVVIFYAAVWLATWALAHHILGLAITVGTAFVIVPGLYVLLRIRVERVAQWLHRGRQG